MFSGWVPILTGLLVLIAVAGLLLFPVRTTGIRVGILGGFLLLALHVIALAWRRRHIGKGTVSVTNQGYGNKQGLRVNKVNDRLYSPLI